ncbi:glycosyltransferase [Streptomyces sp. MUM 203J]|nr:glycosyltransferase [Streptomyces sp. MUM 203J]
MELVRTPLAGGQVKCWERFAAAAASLDPSDLGVDLTLYVLGDRPRTEELSPAVRFVALRPVLSTALLTRRGGVDIADAAPYHPVLARLLPRHEVWHLTHTMAFASTAVRLSRRGRRGRAGPGASGPYAGRGAGPGPGMTASVHTDVPALTEAYIRQSVNARLARVPGLRAFDPAARCAAILRSHRDRVLRACDHVLVATPSQVPEMAALVGAEHVSGLGRGMDLDRFRPDPGARTRLAALGVPPGRTTVLFAGRVDASKNVLLLAEAVRRLRARGADTHLVVAGTGPDTDRVAACLGPGVTLLGMLPQERLARVLAGCDLLALPSRTETIGNIVGEAMACGLPVVLPHGTRTNHWLAAPGRDGLLVEHDTPEAWAAALGLLAGRPDLRAAMGRHALATARARHRTWGRVLCEDLLPVWRRVAARTAPVSGG